MIVKHFSQIFLQENLRRPAHPQTGAASSDFSAGQDFHGDRQAGAPAKRRGGRVRSPLPGERAQSRSTEKR